MANMDMYYLHQALERIQESVEIIHRTQRLLSVLPEDWGPTRDTLNYLIDTQALKAKNKAQAALNKVKKNKEIW